MKLDRLLEIQTKAIDNILKNLKLNIGRQIWAKVIDVKGDELKIAIGDIIIFAQSELNLKPGQNVLLKVNDIRENRVFFQTLVELNQSEMLILDYISKHNIPQTERWIKWLQLAIKLHGSSAETLKAAVFAAREGLPLKKKLLNFLAHWLFSSANNSDFKPELGDLFNMQNWQKKDEPEPGVSYWVWKPLAESNDTELQALVWEGEAEKALAQQMKIWRFLVRIEQANNPAFVSITATSDKEMWVNFFNIKGTITEELKNKLNALGWNIKRWAVLSAVDEMIEETGFSCGIDLKG
ncbi:hypothetical protein SAMN02745885_00187 [Carboxydocella sporoproducens DSM 16521]|uniref:Uncharacterized protein n=2 Tax=Carboxydocella TaxID=178898 RepID=A0A1T4LJU6_9FIRM|nr:MULTISPECIES: hypothetical protein [Carboxydocella]AVX20497.1 hypothetical protein CFE_1308 [Carboxydocella thermautotrophica]GAW29685.1 hypothetical protein ULO1_22550 [Carboxydocella sp. ULO1]SJZ55010.1 hypothetical protein SAMN02745885_00187 [Carboxydocella sporoproducens DSM 16521]